MAPTVVSVIVVLVLGGSALWVYQDASARARRGTAVVLSFGAFEIASPAAWAAGCLCLWILFMPLYLTARKQAD